VAIFIAQLALPRMKAAKPASHIKRFVRLFGGRAPENTTALFFRHTLTILALNTSTTAASFALTIRNVGSFGTNCSFK